MIDGFIRSISWSIGSVIKSTIGRLFRPPNKWDLIKPEEEFKKVEFEKVGNSWTIHYDRRPVGDFNQSELKSIKEKTKTLAYNHIGRKLEVMHWVFKNRKLNDMVTKAFMDKLGYWK